MTTRTFAIELTIPDNEAFTALDTLVRLGFEIGGVRRADVWRFEVDDDDAAGLRDRIAVLETIFNPNKHRLVARAQDAPEMGEVWIASRDERPATVVSGRAIPGVRAVRRATAWRLSRPDGSDVDRATRARVLEAFLCNPASQCAIEPEDR